MKQIKTIKKIKENINEREFKILINYIMSDKSIRENTRVNLLRTFTILYFTGIRLNEIQDMKVFNIKELFKNKETKITLSKTNNQRKIFSSDKFLKSLKPLFNLRDDPGNNKDNDRVIRKGANKNQGINNIVFINMINKKLKDILGSGYSSHSFRQGLISEMAIKGINVKIIAKFIHHSDIKTTMRYIQPSDGDVFDALVR